MTELHWLAAQRRQPINPDVARAPSPAVSGCQSRAGAPALHWQLPPLLVMICLALISASVGWSYGRQADPPPTARIVLVRPGDTLWGIGQSYAGRRDVRDWLVRTADINGWTAAPLLRPGQTLVIEDWRGRPTDDAFGR